MELFEKDTLLTKKGTVRKRKPKEPKNYFTKDTENAILLYLTLTEKKERDKIYKDKIEYAFFKLTQNIIHTFKMYYTDGESIEDLQQEVISVLLEKLYLYKPEKGAAYSYFGTITKRYLILKNQKNYSKLQEKGNLEDIDTDHGVYSSILYEENKDNNNKFIDFYIKYIDKNLYKLFPKENDAKTSDAILELFRKRENIEIFNKKALYIYIREMINIDTPQITKIIKKMKIIYIKLFNEFYEHDYIKI